MEKWRKISGISRSEKVQNLPASGSSSKVRARQMARKLRSARFTPQKLRAELSSNGCSMRLRGAGLTPHFHAELPSDLSMELEECRTFQVSWDCDLVFPASRFYTGPHSLRFGQASRFDVSPVGHGLLVDSSRRQSSSLFSLPTSLASGSHGLCLRE